MGGCTARATGLPPRGRGNLFVGHAAARSDGSTPAWAGQPPDRNLRCPHRGVYPRVGGATLCWSSWWLSRSGLPPRGRGNPRCLGVRLRVVFTGLPPRGRGNLSAVPPGRGQDRSTPAWAGQPPPPSPILRWTGVYPRVGGATTLSRHVRLDNGVRGLPPRGRGNLERNGNSGGSCWGLPPRGRGNPSSLCTAPNVACGSTPAWAGQPGTCA